MQSTIGDPRSNPPIFVGGVDPGQARAGHALLSCGRFGGGCRVLAHGVLEAPTGGGIASVLDSWYNAATAVLGSPALEICVAVEGQWLPDVDRALKDRSSARLGGQVTATMEVAANRGAWMAVAEARGWPAVKVHPSQWRSVLGRAPQHARRRKAVKDRAMEHVRLRAATLFTSAAPKRLQDHLAEAILIGEYYAKKLQQEHLINHRRKS
jgi:Holliday junction resolvasome RuvABC endonuclease subunit